MFSIAGPDVGHLAECGLRHLSGKPWKCVAVEVLNESSGISTPFFCHGWMGVGGGGRALGVGERQGRPLVLYSSSTSADYIGGDK